MGLIYKIINNKTNKIYVGQTKRSLRERKNQHFSELRNQNHYNTQLQEDYNKYGESSFSFEILENNIDEEYLIEKETYWIQSLGGMYSDRLYNQTDNTTISDYNRSQLIKYNKERVLRQDTLQKFSDNNKGSKNPYFNKMKYTQDFISQLRIEHEEGATYIDLEKKYNIDARLLRRLILFGKTTNKKVAEYKKEKRALNRRKKNGYN